MKKFHDILKINDIMLKENERKVLMLKEMYAQSKLCNHIDNELYTTYKVKKGLRNSDGTGVCVGLTKIADVVGYTYDSYGIKQNTEGNLLYRGRSIYEIIHHHKHDGYGYEQTCFLLLFGFMPSKDELRDFIHLLAGYESLSPQFLNSNIWALPTKNIMNKLQQIILMLYSEDETPDAIEPYDILEKGIAILAKLPMIIMHAYYSKFSNFIDFTKVKDDQLHLSFSEQLLYYLRKDHQFTKQEAELLDIMLILHADHGGGNNSTFTNVVISSAGADIYSTISGAIGSMKGNRHGGANIQVCNMMKEIINTIGLCKDIELIKSMQRKILNKEVFDKAGLLYGMGHAVYTLSDPRSEILQTYAHMLAMENGYKDTFVFYQRFEQCAKEVIWEEKGIHVSSNIDFYSGLVYQMLDIPEDLYTPLFVCARTIGWIAHNIENKLYDGRIMRPATKYVGDKKSIKEDTL